MQSRRRSLFDTPPPPPPFSLAATRPAPAPASDPAGTSQLDRLGLGLVSEAGASSSSAHAAAASDELDCRNLEIDWSKLPRYMLEDGSSVESLSFAWLSKEPFLFDFFPPGENKAEMLSRIMDFDLPFEGVELAGGSLSALLSRLLLL